MSQPLPNPDANTLDTERKFRLMMRFGSATLLDRLELFHPRIVRHLQHKHGIERV
jgi:hypothetical protein